MILGLTSFTPVGSGTSLGLDQLGFRYSVHFGTHSLDVIADTVRTWPIQLRMTLSSGAAFPEADAEAGRLRCRIGFVPKSCFAVANVSR